MLKFISYQPLLTFQKYPPAEMIHSPLSHQLLGYKNNMENMKKLENYND